MTKNILILFLIISVLVGFTPLAVATSHEIIYFHGVESIAVSSVTDGSQDSNGNTFDTLDGAHAITPVIIGGSTYALVAAVNDDGVQIIDFSDPYNPLFVASVTDGDVDSNGNTFDALLRVFDVTTVTIGQIPYALVSADRDHAVTIIDISDPYNPILVASIIDEDVDSIGNTFDQLRDASGMSTVTIGTSTYVLVAARYNDGVQIIDISDPYNPLAVASVRDGVDGFDNLDSPRFISTISIGTSTYSLVTSYGDDAVTIIDISTPTNPILVTSIVDGDMDTNGNTFDALVHAYAITTVSIGASTYALVTDDTGIQIIDITIPSNPLVVTSVTDGEDGFDVISEIGGITIETIGQTTYAIVASWGDNGMQIIDISDPYNPISVASAIDSQNGFDKLYAASGVTTVTIDNTMYVLVAAYADDGVQITNFSEQVTLLLNDNIDDPEIIQLNIPIVELDLSNLSEIGNAIILPNLDITTDDVNILFNADTLVTGLSGTNEIITIKPSTKIPTGFESFNELIEFGDPDVDITFDRPVRITLFNQAGGIPFYINAANETFVIDIVCQSDDFATVTAQLDNNECSIDVGSDLVIWTTHFTAFSSSSTSSATTETKKSGGGDSGYLTRPTFGLSHSTYKQIVDDGFGFNYNSFQITHNWHTPFAVQNVTIGEQNSFSAKVYATNKIKVQEFLFGIPSVGASHKAELEIEVWYNVTGGIIDTIIRQDTNVVDPESLFAFHEKVKCQELDYTELCDMTFISVKFLEPLKDDIMAIKAIDYQRRSNITFLNHGFNIDGDSLNPMLEKHIPGPVKHEGLILVTQSAKYSNIWIAEDGRTFESNSFGSFTEINRTIVHTIDPGEPRTRLHSEFNLIQEWQLKRAQATLAEICPKCNDTPFDKIDNIIQIIPNPSNRNSDSELQAWIVYEGIRAQYTLDAMIKETYPDNPYYKEFVKIQD